MRKQQLAAQLARRTRTTKPAAADQLDRVVHAILKGLRRGEPVALPGLGVFIPGKKPGFRFEPRAMPKSPRGGAR